jgi:hypothetical protein
MLLVGLADRQQECLARPGRDFRIAQVAANLAFSSDAWS